MIHVTHTAHQCQKKVFVRNVDTDLVVLSVATVNKLLLRMCPFLPTLLFLILDPTNQAHFQWCTPWTGMKKSTWDCNQCICRFDGPHIYRCSGCNMKVHMTQLKMFSNHRYVLRQCLHKGPLICTSHSRCTTKLIVHVPQGDYALIGTDAV